MVELCGCAGHLVEAEDMIKAMPFKPGAAAPGIVQLNIFAWNEKLTKYVKDGQPQKVLGDCSTRCPLKMWSLEPYDSGTCEMRARAEGTRTI
jgi:hypothetical protein